jgi:beta-lactamase class A
VSSEVEHRIRDLVADAGASATLHVQDLASSRAVSLDADQPVAVASVVKIAFCLGFAREVAAGRIDPHERVEVPPDLRVGGAGTTGCRDPVQMSLRDLALFMMTLSDNAATDIVYGRTGTEAVQRALDDLGLAATHVRGNMRWGHMRVVEELGLSSPEDLDAQLEHADPEKIWGLAWMDPSRSNASTAREVAALLAAIWSDQAGPPVACEFVRTAMQAQHTSDRIATGFEQDGVRVAAKTGTLPAVRNEAGVVTYPDGRHYAVAVFTRARSLSPRQPQIDIAIGAAARMAVDHLRAAR